MLTSKLSRVPTSRRESRLESQNRVVPMIGVMQLIYMVGQSKQQRPYPFLTYHEALSKPVLQNQSLTSFLNHEFQSIPSILDARALLG